LNENSYPDWSLIIKTARAGAAALL